QIIRIADNDRAGRRIGGRLRSSTLDTLILDADVKAYPGDTITVIMPTGTAVSRKIKSVGYPLTWDQNGITWDSGRITFDTTGFPSDVQQVVLAQKLDDLPPQHSMWAIDSATLATQLFRVMSVAEDFSDSEIKFTISAVRHNASKYGAIDNGTRIERPPVTVIPPSVQRPPANVTVSNDHFVDQGCAVSVMTIEWDKPEAAIAYEVYWRKNDGDWIFAGRTGTTSIDVSGIYAGRYVAKVRAI
ncbi:host specificity protein J, partial [Pseudomonas protegens]|nr:host specificity protein J [Pseudomonas protegens]